MLPGAFLPAAERYGLMPTIDRWVIETRCPIRPTPSAGDGAAIGDHQPVRRQPGGEGLAELILALLQRYRVAPKRVCFEITETVAVRNLLAGRRVSSSACAQPAA